MWKDVEGCVSNAAKNTPQVLSSPFNNGHLLLDTYANMRRDAFNCTPQGGMRSLSVSTLRCGMPDDLTYCHPLLKRGSNLYVHTDMLQHYLCVLVRSPACMHFMSWLWSCMGERMPNPSTASYRVIHSPSPSSFVP